MMVKCPECKYNMSVVRAGMRYNRSVKKQRYRCNKCWYWFVPRDAFWKRKFPKDFIVEACSCYKRGMSFQDAADHMNEYKGTKIVPATVFTWVRDYSKILKKME